MRGPADPCKCSAMKSPNIYADVALDRAAHFRRDVLAARMLDVLIQVAEGVRPVSDMGTESQSAPTQVPARVG